MSATPEHVVVSLRPMRERRLRTLDETLAVRLPTLTQSVSRRVLRLPLRSRLRRALVDRRTRQGFVAVNRGDLDVLLAIYHPDAEVDFTAGGAFLPDVNRMGRGRDSIRAIWAAWRDALQDLRLRPEELVDFGTVLMVSVNVSGKGRGSGVEISDRIHDVYRLHDGLISRHESYRDRATAFEAAAAQSSR